ncbi:MAG: SpoIIE family protein phosphatase [Bacteroidetes bacterium]|nr:SpoIIE family protein phosphatase [Bacteroidota bacterium]
MTTELFIHENPSHEISKAYQVLEKKNKDLIDGLYYASSVQQGMMPQERHFKKNGNSYFVFYNPLQIIGGDFFWLGKKDNWSYYAVGDCTGHGVSGAMLSTLAIGFLNYIVYSKKYSDLGEILNEIDKKWIETFKRHEDDDNLNNDWMEISLIAFNCQTRDFQFAGANSNILISSNDHAPINLCGDSFPIGGWQIEKNRQFTTQYCKLKDAAKVYLFSDGFQDQFGGSQNKKIGSRNFKNHLNSISHLPMAQQFSEVEDHFRIWKGVNEQTDDICLLGVEFI